jgi:uncharacterized protein YgbK (DUF1537 family)
MHMLLGCIADDFTGATDLALMLVREGMRTVQLIGVGAVPPDVDAVVIALKSRTIPAPEAVAQSLEAAEALLQAGARQLLFKYCSTFDSTDEGNIGPVAEALRERLDAPLTVATPAFPTNGRRVFQGYLFVGRELLSESPMKDHPLTPMRDPNLVRVLQRQTRSRVGLVSYEVVAQGPEAIRDAFAAAERAGERILILDAADDAQLRAIGAACSDLALITGGSGIALGIPENFRRQGLLKPHSARARMAAPDGPAAILAGSCSAATRRQVAEAEAAGLPNFRLSPEALADGRQSVSDIFAWAGEHLGAKPVLVYSTAAPEEVSAAQARLGRERAAGLLEDTLAAVARGLVSRGVTRLVVAGGETSGAVIEGLGVTALEIGPEIDPGVPWTRSLSEPRLCLALKSGNFGAPDFFLKAWDRLK